MTMSDYIKNLRSKIGNDLLMLPTVSGVLVNDQKEILMIQHTDAGLWLLPGGMIEPGEAPRFAVQREMLEELGVQVEVLDLVDVSSGSEFMWTYKNGHQVCFVMSTFICGWAGGAFKPDAAEILSYQFVTEDECMKLAMPPWMKITVPDVFAFLRD